jgi:hypothetical protein
MAHYMGARQHGDVLSGILLVGWGSRRDTKAERFVKNEEMRFALLDADDQFRGHILLLLKRWSEGEDDLWRDQIVEFLRDVWPIHMKARTPKYVLGYVIFLLRNGRNFQKSHLP